MVHITLSIPDNVYKEMKKHKEIKWSEAARRGIVQELHKLREEIEGKEWLSLLSEETKKHIHEAPKSPEQWRRWLVAMRKKEWKRAHY